jgi:hypothetical protein
MMELQDFSMTEYLIFLCRLARHQTMPSVVECVGRNPNINQTGVGKFPDAEKEMKQSATMLGVAWARMSSRSGWEKPLKVNKCK